MGRSYQYRCEDCSYAAVISGGEDRGFRFYVRSINCTDCRKLYDVVTGIRKKTRSAKLPTEQAEPREATIRKDSPPDIDPNDLREIEIKLNCLSGSLNSKSLIPSPQRLDKTLTLQDAPFQWQDFKIACPMNRLHKVELWNDPGKCPHCGYGMEKSLIPFRYWE